MSKHNLTCITAYFTQKNDLENLPTSVNGFLKEKLSEASKENVAVDESVAVPENEECDKNDSTKIQRTEQGVAKLKTELEKANDQIKKLKMKLSQQNEYALKNSNRLCVAKDLKIERLLAEKSKITVGKSEKNSVMFGKFENHIDPSVLKQLRNLPKDQSQDSKLVLLLMRHLYQNNLSILSNRTALGKGKTPITPEKKTNHT